MDLILSWFNFLPAEVLTFVVAATPISELRGAIPLALGVFGFSPVKSFIIAWVGNLLPAVFLPIFYYLIRVLIG